MTAPMTDAEIREALARAERASAGPWLTGILDGPFNPETCAKYVEACLDRGALAEFWLVSCVKPDGVADVCHVGNGPTSPQNADFLAAARTDVPRLAADLLAARAERDEARASLSTPTLAKRQPCGCVVCTCGDVERCGGCGARMCDRHRDDRPSLANDPATVWEAHPLLARAESAEKARDEARAAWKLTVERPTKEELRSALARAETAEARCRELEAERAIVADYLRDTDADFRARRPSERAVLDALLSPQPPHTCQIHRATSGASDCGLSPCEEATVHRDRGAARPAENATPEAAKCATCGHEERRHLSEDGDGARWCDVALCDCVDYAALEVNRG